MPSESPQKLAYPAWLEDAIFYQVYRSGFSTASPAQFYLPLDPDPARPNVASQDADPDSLLNHVRRLAALRRAHPALHASAGFKPLFAEAGRCPFVFLRSSPTDQILVGLNPSAGPVEVELTGIDFLAAHASVQYSPAGALVRQGEKWLLQLPPISGGMFKIF